jgi:hypothetical protein
MWKSLKTQNPEKEYPSNLGKLWTEEEETQLLEELEKNIDIEIISQTHNRTKNGIYARRKLIAYKLYNNKISIEEIIEKTKLNEKEIMEFIEKRKIKKEKIKKEKKENNEKKELIIEEPNKYNIFNNINSFKEFVKEMDEMKKEMNELKQLLHNCNLKL